MLDKCSAWSSTPYPILLCFGVCSSHENLKTAGSIVYKKILGEICLMTWYHCTIYYQVWHVIKNIFENESESLEVKGKAQVPILAFHLVWDTATWLSTIVFNQLAGLQAPSNFLAPNSYYTLKDTGNIDTMLLYPAFYWFQWFKLHFLLW